MSDPTFEIAVDLNMRIRVTFIRSLTAVVVGSGRIVLNTQPIVAEVLFGPVIGQPRRVAEVLVPARRDLRAFECFKD